MATVTTKGKGKTTTATVGQPVAATTTIPATPGANPVPTQAQAQIQVDGVDGIKFAAPAAAKTKSDRPFCDHVDSKGKRCALRVLTGFGQCVNHVPDESRLTAEEAQAVIGWKSEMTDAQWVRFVARSIGWWKTKQCLSGTPEGDVTLAGLTE